MPELPEVDALAAFLGEHAVGRRVARVELVSLAALKTYDPPLHSLEGEVVAGTARRGKFLMLAIADCWLVIHLARAGWLHWRDEMPTSPAKPGKGPLALRVSLVTDDGEPAGGFDLTEAGTRKGLAIYVVRDPAEVAGIARLGPDPLDASFTAEDLGALLLEAGRGQIKGVLRDQSVLAGIGNAYSDEILFAARVSPFAPAQGVDPELLLREIRAVLGGARDAAAGQAAARLKSEKKAAMKVHGRTGQPCPVCGDTVREVAFADRSLQYCPTCQTEGRILADRRMSRLLK